MKLEEVLPYYREGRSIRCNDWAKVESVSTLADLTTDDLLSDKWELLPKPPVVIDLVQYADGYEYEFGERNCTLEVDIAGKYVRVVSKNWKALGSVYMSEKKIFALVSNLNSGEWVLK